MYVWLTLIELFSTAEVFDSEKDFEAYVQKDNNYEKVLAAIIFDENFENNVPYWVRKFYSVNTKSSCSPVI